MTDFNSMDYDSMDSVGALVANKSLVVESADLTLEQKVIALLVCTGQEIRAEIDRLLEGTVPSFSQLNLLHALSRAPGGCLTVGQLKNVMVDDSPNVSRALNKLAGLGLVEKTRSTEDQRTVFVSITERGQRVHEEGDECLAHLSTGLEQSELKRLYDLLVKL